LSKFKMSGQQWGDGASAAKQCPEINPTKLQRKEARFRLSIRDVNGRGELATALIS